MSESKEQKKVSDLLDELGWSVKTIRTNKTGTPDLLACVPITKKQALRLFKKQKHIGLFVAIEMKDPITGGVTSPMQKYRIKEILKSGGLAFVAKSLDKVKETLGKL